MKTFFLFILLVLQLNAPTVMADDAASSVGSNSVLELEEVTVKSLQDPAAIPYRKALKALDAFDRYHALAPTAAPRFEVSLRAQKIDPGRDALALQLVGSDSSIEIPLAGDHTFSLQRNQKAEDEEANLILNRKKSLYAIWPYINSPGVGANERRLGDLRLQCEMIWVVIKDDLNFLVRNGLEALGGACHAGIGTVAFRAPRRLAGATLVSGGRREPLSPKLILANGLAYNINPALHDKSWSDNTLIEFEFAPETVVR